MVISKESDLPTNLTVGIYEESQHLQITSTWGPLGAEAVLAQALPEKMSLFFEDFDVAAARLEGLAYAETLEGYGVQVIPARDSLAHVLPQTDSLLTRTELLDNMIRRTRELQDQYGHKVRDFGDQIASLVNQDMERYGEEVAIRLNSALCLSNHLPLGNLMYARDQMNVLLDWRVTSSMAKPIRKPEVDIYERIYSRVLGPHKILAIPKNEHFEGGDAYIHNGYLFVGVGARTTLNGAVMIYQMLRDDLEKAGLKFAIVQDPNPSQRSYVEQQDFMHLDTFSNPIGQKEIAVCLEEAQRRVIREVTMNSGVLVVRETGPSFMNFLEQREDEVVEIPLEEQQGFGCNFLLLGNHGGRDTILVPRESNTLTNAKLAKLGKDVVYVSLLESTKGYGAAHCMTGQIMRAN